MDVLFSDEALLIVDKPAGMAVLPDGWEPDSPYLLKLLEQQFGKLWVVHRLDKVTSGVMVVARTAEAHRALNMQFERHETQKSYHAICNGVPKWDEHTAKHKLRVNVGHSHRTVVDNSNGKPTETQFKLIKRYTDYGLLECIPATGRPHQIRVHAYALGHPLLGDILYSAPKTKLIARPALHSYSLAFTHPGSGERVSFNAPYPADFATALNTLSTF